MRKYWHYPASRDVSANLSPSAQRTIIRLAHRAIPPLVLVVSSLAMRVSPWDICKQARIRQGLIASVPAMSTSVTPGQFGFILRWRGRLRRFVILLRDRSRGALIRMRCAARRRANRFIDRLSRLLISIFTPRSRASDILAGRTFTFSHKSPQSYRLVMKLLCREHHNGGAYRSGVGDPVTSATVNWPMFSDSTKRDSQRCECAGYASWRRGTLPRPRKPI